MKSLLNIFLIIVLLLLSASCTKNSELKDDDVKATAALVGVWRGTGTYAQDEDAGWEEIWKIVRQADGNYEVSYLLIHDNEKLYELSFDTGTWFYEEGVYYEINSQGDKVRYDVYSVKEDWFEYNIAERQGSANIEESKTVDTYQLQKPPEGYSEVSYEQSSEDEPVEESEVEALIESTVESN